MKAITIFVLSDSIGETGGKIARACIKQFDPDFYEIKRFPYVLGKKNIDEIFEEAKNIPSIVIFTTVLEEHALYIEELGRQYNIPTVNVMSNALDAISKVLKENPKREAGIVRRMDESYFQKVNAIEFAVKYDDGKDPRGIVNADIVLVGISRTSKTPLSMYLANKNYRVANIPLVPEVEPAKELFKKDPGRIFGLIASKEKMNEIRLERLKSMGLENIGNYANDDRIEQELEYSKSIMKRLNCTVIDVTNMAIEETAGIILDEMRNRFSLPEET